MPSPERKVILLLRTNLFYETKWCAWWLLSYDAWRCMENQLTEDFFLDVAVDDERKKKAEVWFFFLLMDATRCS